MIAKSDCITWSIDKNKTHMFEWYPGRPYMNRLPYNYTVSANGYTLIQRLTGMPVIDYGYGGFTGTDIEIKFTDNIVKNRVMPGMYIYSERELLIEDSDILIHNHIEAEMVTILNSHLVVKNIASSNLVLYSLKRIMIDNSIVDISRGATASGHNENDKFRIEAC